MQERPDEAVSTDDHRCAECGTTLDEGQDREVTQDGVFCRPCFASLTAQLQQAIASQGQAINYPMALLGGLLGGAVGVLVWWGFTVLTSVHFGLVAVVIGITVGKGILYLTGGKRSVQLQVLSVVLAAAAFFYASYLVNRTFLQRALADEGHALVLPLLPDPALFVNVLTAGFDLKSAIFDLVFLSIVVWQAWKIPAPFSLEA